MSAQATKPEPVPEEPKAVQTPPLPRRSMYETLRTVFGFPHFKLGQEDVIRSVLNGRDTLAVMPTGGGKSLCYQLPALHVEGTVLVVSPLIALMKDQVDHLKKLKIRAAALNSSMKASEQDVVLKALEAGILKLLYVAPERLASTRFLKVLERATISTVVVDEAHCISYWGHDFRPDYLRLKDLIKLVKPRCTLAVTATASPRVRKEIVEKLGLQAPFVHVNPFDRPNIELAVAKCPAHYKLSVLRGVLERLDGASIVYVPRRKDAEEVALMLRNWNFNALPYHAGMKKGDRTANQEAFLDGACNIIVATIAFGMGIDKPDIRAVIHYAMPNSLDAYYQEVGRAGRDGLPSLGLVLYTPEDRELHEWFINRRMPSRELIHAMYEAIRNRTSLDEITMGNEESRNGTLQFLQSSGYIEEVAPDEWVDTGRGDLPDDLDLEALEHRKEGDQWRLDEMVGYCEAESCRRRILLEYFGERKPRGYRCERCDRCGSKKLPLLRMLLGKGPKRVKLDMEQVLREVCLDPVLATLHTSTVARILTASDIKREVVRRMKGSRWFGALRGRGRKEVREKLLRMRLERPMTNADPPPRIGKVIVDFVRRRDGMVSPEAMVRILGANGYSPSAKRFGKESYPNFGKLARHPAGQVRNWIRAMVKRGILRIANDRVYLA